MRITIENFGPVKHFEFDTEKDLFLIFGKNSVGKSYAISLVYLLLKEFKRPSKTATFDAYWFLKGDIEEEAETHSKKEPAARINTHLVKFFNASFISNLNSSLINSFIQIDNLQNQLTDDKLKITLAFPKAGATLIMGLKTDVSPMVIEISDCQFQQRMLDHIDNIDKLAVISGLRYSMMLAHAVARFYTELPDISEAYYLPASRSGLYQGLAAFSPIIAELSKSRNLISKPITLPAISEPVADYFLRLSEIDSQKHSGLGEYTDMIENAILQGKVEFNDDSKRLAFKPNGLPLRLDLLSVSSMVSEIAPIVSYLKHIVPNAEASGSQAKPLLFIEEPEAHLHPETQVKLMEVFSRLVNDGKIKLVMTSHSNYIFNKASNLVMDGKIPLDKFEALLFRMTETGSVAEKMPTDAYGIDDDNFIDTAESLYEEKLAIINKMNG
ncbi:MAG: AAA family ATPase [Methylovulum sp.]|nr:AAA family ATPase [Methylovulum sp.]